MKRPTLSRSSSRTPAHSPWARARRVRAGALALVGITALSGALSACEPTQIGAAAIVGQHRLSVDTVQQRVREVIAERSAPGSDAQSGDLQRLVVRSYVIGELLDTLAAREGVSVTPAQVDARLSQLAPSPAEQSQLEQSAVSGGVPKSQIRDVVRMGLLEQAVVEKLTGSAQPTQAQADQKYVPVLVGLAKQMHVQVNPRYGVWDAATLQINAPALPSPSSGSGPGQ